MTQDEVVAQEYEDISLEKCNEMLCKLQKYGDDKGLEVHAFKVGWYNEVVGKRFHLDCPYDAVAYIVISQPSMFERCFIPFIKRTLGASLERAEDIDNGDNNEETAAPRKEVHRVRLDPLDECMKHTFAELCACLPGSGCHALHDFTQTARRRPAVLVQTAGHVSGAVCMYRAEDAALSTPPAARLFPVCLHPRWGGWFALRGVLLPRVACPALPRPPARRILGSPEEVAALLAAYNSDWRRGAWRDACRPEQRYSQAQRDYFATPPGHRLARLTEILQLAAEGEAGSEGETPSVGLV